MSRKSDALGTGAIALSPLFVDMARDRGRGGWGARGGRDGAERSVDGWMDVEKVLMGPWDAVHVGLLSPYLEPSPS